MIPRTRERNLVAGLSKKCLAERTFMQEKASRGIMLGRLVVKLCLAVSECVPAPLNLYIEAVTLLKMDYCPWLLNQLHGLLPMSCWGVSPSFLGQP